MNNKIIARIMAAVICVCMMSTVAFAADPTLTVDGDTAILSFLVGENDADITESDEAQITMMAYLVDAEATAVPAYTNQTIIALDQVAGSEGFGDVSIAASKLDGTSKIAVVVGGSDGETVSYLINQAAPAPVVTTYTVAYELNGGALAESVTNATSFTNETVAAFLEGLNAPAKADLVVDTDTATTTTVYTFAGWYLDSAFTTAATAENIAASATTAITLYAKYTEATSTVEKPQAVTVTLNGNGGKFGDATTLAIEVAANATFADVLAAGTYAEPTKTKTNVKGDKLDWAFVGWYTDAACETAVDLNATVSATNLYAKFVQVYIVGDANEDGVVNATDYAQIKLYYRSTATPKVNANFPAIGNLIPDNAYTVKKTDQSEVVYKVGDINGDGNVNATDYAQVKLYYRSTSSPKENANFVTIGKAVTIKKD